MRTGFAYQRVDEALEKAAVHIRPPGPVEVKAVDAYGQILADDLESPLNLPTMPTAFVDGYAVRGGDLAGGTPVTLKLLKLTALGEVPDFKIGPREACWVPTGGFVPGGADAVVMVEKTSRISDAAVRIQREAKPGENVIPVGSDFRKGEKVLVKGTRLRSQEIGVLNMLGIDRAQVFQRPRVGTISVGNELVDSTDRMVPGKVMASHRYVVGKIVQEEGGEWLDYGIVGDDEDEIKEKLREALRECHLVLTIGGTSMGEADLMPESINALGKPGMIVHGIKVQPGRPTGLGIIDGKPIVILPGLLQSAILGYYALASPILRRLSRSTEQVPYTWLPLETDLKFTRFIDFQKATFVKLVRKRDGVVVEPISSISYYNSVLVKADGFTITPEDVEKVNRGELVKVFFLPGFGRIPF